MLEIGGSVNTDTMNSPVFGILCFIVSFTAYWIASVGSTKKKNKWF